MGLAERIALEFCLITVTLVVVYELVRMWRERRRTRRELWQVLYEKGKNK